jgi:hypothetical protein
VVTPDRKLRIAFRIQAEQIVTQFSDHVEWVRMSAAGARKGRHPALGLVTLRQLLATWTAHNLAHLLQMSHVMARRYKQEVGPWAEYLSVMK